MFCKTQILFQKQKQKKKQQKIQLSFATNEQR